MLRVKICGITRREDALSAAESGADAVGFIFYPRSPRYISRQGAANITRALPGHVSRIGVFVNPAVAELQETIEWVGLDAVQIHGKHNLTELRQIESDRLIYAFQVNDSFEAGALQSYHGISAAILLDAFERGSYGGTGKTFNWEIARKAGQQGRIILAGGLNPQNSAAAVREAAPYAIDVNSGVEERPGIKDHHKVKELFDNIKEFRNDWKADIQQRFPLA
jgi:phosphoribosylanthranilate isomerase